MPAPLRERVIAAGAAENAERPVLSILTPFYKHDPSALIMSLAETKAPVELVLLDDGSQSADLIIKTVRAAHHCGFPVRIIVREDNAGRAAARNRLAEAARGDYALFLDADMTPDNADFIARWLDLIDREAPAAAFGGLSLKAAHEDKATALHYRQFAASDCRNAEERNRDPAQFTATSNLLVRRDVLLSTPFDDGFVGWGWEDVDWALRASSFGPIRHIDNSASHSGLDTVDALLRKYREGARNYARLATKHPEAVRRMASWRAARWLRKTPLNGALCAFTAWLARDPLGLTPMLARRAALKLHRTTLYARGLA